MRPLAVREVRTLGEVDPAAAWALLGDLARAAAWSPVSRCSWQGDVPARGDRFAAELRRAWGGSTPIGCRVAAWEAGARFRIDLEGLSRLEEPSFEVALRTEPRAGEPRATVSLTFRAKAGLGMRLVARPLAARRLRRSLRRLERLLR